MLGFRVWDSEEKRFVNLDYQVMNRNGDLGLMDRDCDFQREEKRYIPMQSTGVKDWQDKPIYEGDMLFIHYHEKSLTNEYYLVNTAREFLLFYGARMLSIYKIANDGNVYECPSLLEKLK